MAENTIGRDRETSSTTTGFAQQKLVDGDGPNTRRAADNREITAPLTKTGNQSPRQWILQRINLNHPTPSLLTSDQWGYPRFYMVWRVFVALYHIGWCLYMWIDEAITKRWHGKWLIYLTNWTYLLLTIYTILKASVVLYVKWKVIEFSGWFAAARTPFYLKTVWVLFEVVSVGSVLVSVLFFALLFDGSMDEISGACHVGNSLYIILDSCVTAMPVHLLHVIYPMIYAIVYALFSIIYWIAGGINSDGCPYIYETLNWDKAQMAAPLAIGIILVGIPLGHLFIWLLYLIRVTVYRGLYAVLPCKPAVKVFEMNGVRVCNETPSESINIIVVASSEL